MTSDAQPRIGSTLTRLFYRQLLDLLSTVLECILHALLYYNVYYMLGPPLQTATDLYNYVCTAAIQIEIKDVIYLN